MMYGGGYTPYPNPREMQVDQALAQTSYTTTRNQVRAAVITFLNEYPNFSFQTEPYQSPGQPKCCIITIFGTIRINQSLGQGQPVQPLDVALRLLLPLMFPYNAPVVSITPGPGMQIAQVDYMQGPQILIPYMKAWSPNTSTINEMMKLMLSLFSQAPPICKGGHPPPYGGGGYLPGHAPPAPQGYMPYPRGQPPPQFSASLPDVANSYQVEKARLINKLKEKLQDHNNNFAQEMKEASGNVLLCSTAFERNDQIMDQKIAHLDLCCNEMKKAMAELDNEFIRLQQEISSKESIDISLDNIENIVKPTNEHHDRLAKLDAKIMGIEDIMSDLKRAIETGSITLSEFMDKTRNLARKQFIKLFKRQKLMEFLIVNRTGA